MLDVTFAHQYRFFPYTTLFLSSPAGDTLVAGTVTAETQGDICLVPIATPEKRRQFVATEAREYQVAFSPDGRDRKSTRLNSSDLVISYAVFCLINNNIQKQE